VTVGHAPTLLNWAGSKARVAKALCQLGRRTFGTYHEPFLGSGAAFFGLASAGLILKSLLSDVNHRLVNVFRATQIRPHDVVAGLRMHAILDSDVHFSAVLGRMNSWREIDEIDCQLASDTIYLLSQSFHSTWYETRNGQIAMSRRESAEAIRARSQDVVRAAALLRGATVQCRDFRSALEFVAAGDLVFLDPPYLYGDDRVDQQSYNVERFGIGEIQFLSTEMRRMVDLGAHLIFCWGEQAEALVPACGSWTEIGRDFVWLSAGLARTDFILETSNQAR